MFHFIQETFLDEGPSKEAHLEPTDSFRLTQTGVSNALQPQSSRERGQMKHHCSDTVKLRTGKQLKSLFAKRGKSTTTCYSLCSQII